MKHQATKASNTEAERPWSDAEVNRMHEWVLNDSVAKLFDRRSQASTRESIIGWITRPSTLPFSFRACCAVQGIDSQQMEDHLLERYVRFTRMLREQRLPRLKGKVPAGPIAHLVQLLRGLITVSTPPPTITTTTGAALVQEEVNGLWFRKPVCGSRARRAGF